MSGKIDSIMAKLDRAGQYNVERAINSNIDRSVFYSVSSMVSHASCRRVNVLSNIVHQSIRTVLEDQ